MKRMSCVFVAIAILACSTQVFAQKGQATPRPGDKSKERMAEALMKSKPITIRVRNPKDLSGTGIKNGEVKGVVKSTNAACFQFEYKDARGRILQDCIPYGGAGLVEWHTRALHTLKQIGKWSPIVALSLVALPFVMPLLIIAGLLGYGFDC